MLLSDGLDLESPAILAAVGAGGKTTALARLAAELTARGACVISTTTTNIWEPSGTLIVEAEEDALLQAVTALLGPGRALTVASRRFPVQDGAAARLKLAGVGAHLPSRLRALPGVDYVLVEADGARGRSIKAPASHEPVMPEEADVVLALVGMDAVGAPLADGIAHRPELLAALLGLGEGALLAPQHIAALLASPDGGRKGVPPGARYVPFLNKVEDQAALNAARDVAGRLRGQPGIERLLIGAALAPEPVLEVWRR